MLWRLRLASLVNCLSWIRARCAATWATYSFFSFGAKSFCSWLSNTFSGPFVTALIKSCIWRIQEEWKEWATEFQWSRSFMLLQGTGSSEGSLPCGGSVMRLAVHTGVCWASWIWSSPSHPSPSAESCAISDPQLCGQGKHPEKGKTDRGYALAPYSVQLSKCSLGCQHRIGFSRIYFVLKHFYKLFSRIYTYQLKLVWEGLKRTWFW